MNVLLDIAGMTILPTARESSMLLDFAIRKMAHAEEGNAQAAAYAFVNELKTVFDPTQAYNPELYTPSWYVPGWQTEKGN